MTYDFAGKHVLITGANRGIGLGIAEGFLAAGSDVTIVALEDDVVEVAGHLTERYQHKVGAIQCDIADDADIARLATAVGSIDVLINNAGLEYITPIADPNPMVDQMFRSIIAINVIGTFSVTRALLGHIADGGRVINTASMWGKMGVAEFSAYCASKHAVIGLTRSLAHELAPRRISVNAVCPGWVRTAASMRSLAHMAEREKRAESDLLREIISAQALDGLMEPKDMAAIYMFLASDAADNITGQAYSVDRGELMQ